VAAKKSSYYCLTPASSTTSLSDLNNSKSLLEDFSSANNTSLIARQKKSSSIKTKQILTHQQSLSSVRLNEQNRQEEEEEALQELAKSNSKKRTRLSIDTYKCTDLDLNTSLNNNNNNKLTHTLSASTFMQPTAAAAALDNREVTVGGRGRRGRGRPPKNANLIINSIASTSQVSSNDLNRRAESNLQVSAIEVNKKQFEDCDEQKEIKKPQYVDIAKAVASISHVSTAKQIDTTGATTKANSKLIKSLINKSSSNSNLQKSKVQVDSNENKSTSSKAITKCESASNLLQKKSIVSIRYLFFDIKTSKRVDL